MMIYETLVLCASFLGGLGLISWTFLHSRRYATQDLQRKVRNYQNRLSEAKGRIDELRGRYGDLEEYGDEIEEVKKNVTPGDLADLGPIVEGLGLDPGILDHPLAKKFGPMIAGFLQSYQAKKTQQSKKPDIHFLGSE